jgi:hypothetical protein
MNNEMKTMKSVDELGGFLDKALVDYPHATVIPFTVVQTVAEAFNKSCDIVLSIRDINLNKAAGEPLIPLNPLSLIEQSVFLKFQADKNNIRCAYIHMPFININDHPDKYSQPYAINSFPIEGQGDVYYSPHARCFIREEPKEGLFLNVFWMKKPWIINDNEYDDSHNITIEGKEPEPINSYNDLHDFLEIPFFENVPFLASWQNGFGNVLEFVTASLKGLEDINNQCREKGIRGHAQYPTRSHAMAMKDRANRHGIKCAYIELSFINSITKDICFVCGINAFPILNQGTCYYSPMARAYITEEPKEGMDFGEMKLKTCKLIW